MTEILKPTRRGFIKGLGALITAPAIVKIQSIMPVKAILPLSYEEILKESIRISIDHLSDAIMYGMLYTKIQMNEVGLVKTMIVPFEEIYKFK